MVYIEDALKRWVAASVQKALCIVRLGGATLTSEPGHGQLVSVDVDIGYDQQSSAATIRLPADQYPSSWEPPTKVEIEYGYAGVKGGTKLVFSGEVEDVDTKYIPYFIELKASSRLKRAQRNAGNTLNSGDPSDVNNTPVLTWADMTDSQIWESLMALANIPVYVSGAGDSRTITGPLYMLPGDNIRDKIDELDKASDTGQRTFEYAGVVYRRPALRVPLGIPKYSYNEGAATYPEMRVYSLDRRATDRSVMNQMIVKGVPAAGADPATVVGAVVQQVSPYWGYDASGRVIYVPFSTSSQFIETRAVAAAVAERYMIEKNKLTDLISMRTPLNPFPIPGESVGIKSARITGSEVRRNYFVTKVHHHWGADGATTDWSLEGGEGAQGPLIGLPPQALFTVKATQETWLVAGVRTTFITVTADGSSSSDPDGSIAGYAWSNNKNGDTGTAVIYTTVFTLAQWNDTTTPPAIQLIVTDSDTPDPHTNSTGMLDVHSMLADGDLALIAMYVAAWGAAYATPDGWQTVNSWTPGGPHVISVGRIGAEGTNYFGLDDGHIYKTTDYLASTPTAVSWAAPGGSAVNAIWLSEINSNVIAIGLDNGDFWLTQDAFATAPVLMRNFGSPVRWINGSKTARQWRACAGQNVWYTDNDFSGARALSDTFGGLTAVQTELTEFANYGSARGSAGDTLLKREGDGFPFTPTGVTPLPAEIHMTAFINTDTLLLGDDQGRTYLSEPASAGTAPVLKTPMGYGFVHDLLRDNTNNAAAYGAANTAITKTPDRGVTWHSVLDLDGTTTIGRALGYDSALLTPVTPVTLEDQLVERGLQPLGNGHDYPEGDDSAQNRWGADLWSPGKPTDPDGSRNIPPPAGWYGTTYVPADWTDSLGTVHKWKYGPLGLGNVIVNSNLQVPVDRFGPFWVISDYTNSVVPSGWAGTAGPGQHPNAAFIYKFKLPNMTLGKVLYELYTSYQAFGGGYGYVQPTEFYVNGTRRSDCEGTGSTISRAAYVDPAWFTADGTTENFIAVLANYGVVVFNNGLMFKFTYGSDTGSVSLLTTPGGKIYWGSTAEATATTRVDDGDGSWKNLNTGSLATPGGAVGVLPPGAGFFTGIYEPPWPVFGKESGKKIANMLNSGGIGLGATAMYFTQSVDMSAGADTAWKLQVRKFDPHCRIYDIYLNGTRLSLPSPVSASGGTANLIDATHLIYQYDIPSGLINMGGRNTAALKTSITSSESSSVTNVRYGTIAWVFKQQ